ncbi:FecR domain-containing protein [Bordetella sp. BOR01]|uniref:FecR family protein n=1 Tax=Bordetella sp. BOR01 TaxID=2854779 RepID=UPI001C46B6F1|nr:FecR domain-containing protein [Bordetella sp. BOR01]MBV7485763.1 FecR domain-containing protein [Bordetella sp. BOR01]
MAPDPSSSQTPPLADQVIDWLLLLRSGRATQHDYAEFLAWRDANPQHNNAWQQLTGTLGGATFGRLGDSYPAGYDSDLPPLELQPVSHARRRFLGGAALLAAGGMSAAYVGNMFFPLGSLASDAATGTGERRRYMLSDGSELLLDARSRIDLNYTANTRKLKLLAGAVTVAASTDDKRPFTVETAEGTIRSGGSRYMVRQQPHRTLVVAHDDPITIETLAGAHDTLRPGLGVRFDAVRVGVPRAELAAQSAWEDGLIDARGQPLGEIVQALRPYYSGSLRVSMAAGGLPVFGEYPLDDVNATLRTLEGDMPIDVRRFTPWFVTIGVVSA